VGAEDPGHALPLGTLAYPLMPADAGRRGQVIEAPPDWRFDPDALDPSADAVVWGRMPDRTESLRLVARRAAGREATLRTVPRRIPSRLRLVGIHRLRPRRLQAGGVRGRARAALRAGALVELSASPRGNRVLDEVLKTAQARRPDSSLQAGSGGALLVRVVLADGSAGLLRIARVGTPGDPAAAAEVLELLAAARVPLVPAVHARGRSAGASWVVEEALPGRRPGRAGARLVRQVADLCTAFPLTDGPPTATAADLAGIEARLPDRARAVARLADAVSIAARGLPAVLRHGDLWAGNLLVGRGALTGLVDWDAAHPAGIPGADLVQLFGTEFRRRARQALGPAVASRPWRRLDFSETTGAYWRAVGVRADEDLLDVAGIAWWATEVNGTLTRLPHRAADEAWVETNVDGVLSALGY
jgi:Phosphotransferase enzyme family